MPCGVDLDRTVHDVVAALGAGMSKAGKSLIINSACWIWSGAKGKYVGCPYWSHAALAELSVRGPGRWGDWCRHEHIVPRAVLTRLVVDLADPTPARVRDSLTRMAIGCVVTIDEDRRLNRGMKQKMPPAFDTVGDPLHQDPWARYRRAGVAWVGPIVWRDGAPVLDGSSVTKRG